MRTILLALGLPATLALAACATLSTTQNSNQVSTLADAIQADTLVNQIADTWIKTGHPTADQLSQAADLSSAVHSELVTLEKAQAAGQSLTFTAFNQALQALERYEAANMASTVAAVATAS